MFIVRIFTFLVIGINLCSVLVSEAADTGVPEVVTAGIDAYIKSGSGAAIEAWIKGSAVESNRQQRDQIAKTIQQVETLYGKMLGWELVRVVPITASCRRVYGALKYEKGPLWTVFDCYKSNAWILADVQFHTEAKEVLPASILSGGTAQ
jgi:hypothetical protein